MRVVSDAQHRRPNVQAFADRVSFYFVPVVVVLAAVTWLVWASAVAAGLVPSFYVTHCGLSNGQLLAFMFGCSVLVIACPCALGLATPTAVMVGGGVAASHGILIKGGDVLEAASKVDAILLHACYQRRNRYTWYQRRNRYTRCSCYTRCTRHDRHIRPKVDAIIFDKTGTLTTGVLAVTDVVLLSESAAAPQDGAAPPGQAAWPSTESQMLTICAAAERGSVRGRRYMRRVERRLPVRRPPSMHYLLHVYVPPTCHLRYARYRSTRSAAPSAAARSSSGSVRRSQPSSQRSPAMASNARLRGGRCREPRPKTQPLPNTEILILS